MGKCFFLLIMTFVLSVPCFADLRKVVSCESLLGINVPTKPATAFDFDMSDLEGLYVELVEDAVVLGESSMTSNPTRLEDFFKKKADFFNRFSRIIFLVRADQTGKLAKKVKIRQLALMSYYLGVAPKNFGFRMDSNRQIVLPPYPVKNPIGFVNFSKKEVEEETQSPRYSIGFAPMEIKEDEVPLRKGGGIEFMELPGLRSVAVGDFEKQKIYKASSEILRAIEAETEEMRYQLTYSQQEGEWIVAFYKKINPSGQIGFIPVKNGE